MWEASTGLTGRRGYPWWVHDGRRTLYTDGGNDDRIKVAGDLFAVFERLGGPL